MDIDAQINAWGLERFIDDPGYAIWNSKDHAHLSNCPDAIASGSDPRWLCGCYSSYTRDDDFNITFEISCSHGVSYTWECELWRYGGVPGVLIALMDSTETHCPYGVDY